MGFTRVDMPTAEDALPGRETSMLDTVSNKHLINGNAMKEPFPEQTKMAMFGMGCFWGVEKLFWQLKGVYSTQAGYSAGFTPNPTYEEVCTGGTGHAEVVRVVYDPKLVSYEDLLTVFWEQHDPTQGMRQGPSVGSQYRSGIYCYDEEQRELAEETKARFEKVLSRGRGSGGPVPYGSITTEILDASVFYYAEDYHQQYLEKNPHKKCGEMGLGVKLNSQ